MFASGVEWLLIGIARALLPLLQSLPLRWVARVGRAGGGLAWHLDRRHRRAALENLQRSLGCDADEAVRVARENFRRIGENYASGIRALGMSCEELRPHLEWRGVEKLQALLRADGRRCVVLVTGHFGNFELMSRVSKVVDGDWAVATTYRALRQPAATRVLLRLRAPAGCLFFERRQDAAALRQTLRERKVVLGLFADQHDGRGVRVPFLGREAGTSVAPALLALRHRCPLVVLLCFRTGLAQWRLEIGDALATRDEAGRARPVEDIARDMNAAFEDAIRRDPANWFWVHRRWKPARAARPRPVAASAPASASA